MLATLDLAHVRARNACQGCELVLSDCLSDTRCAYGLPKRHCWSGLIRRCASGTTWLNSGLLHQQKRRIIRKN